MSGSFHRAPVFSLGPMQTPLSAQLPKSMRESSELYDERAAKRAAQLMIAFAKARIAHPAFRTRFGFK
jgi:hypothetical protein